MRPEDIQVGMTFTHVDFAGCSAKVLKMEGTRAFCVVRTCFTGGEWWINLATLADPSKYRQSPPDPFLQPKL